MARRRKPQRPLTAGEEALWRQVTKKITPLPEHTAAVDLIERALTKPHPEEAKPPAKTPPRPSLPKKKPTLAKKEERKKPAPRSPLETGDPNLAKRVGRGRISIGATLDLHGMTQTEARRRLMSFIDFAMLRGERVVLVITGKGARDADDAMPFAEAPRGILRRRFLEWIEEPGLRGRIAQVRQAHQRHGGRGAFYVFLKRT